MLCNLNNLFHGLFDREFFVFDSELLLGDVIHLLEVLDAVEHLIDLIIGFLSKWLALVVDKLI